VPEQAPDQPRNTEPGSGVAERVTCVPCPKRYAHAEPQSIPAGSDVTVPRPRLFTPRYFDPSNPTTSVALSV
jgi:hypothetical protein